MEAKVGRESGSNRKPRFATERTTSARVFVSRFLATLPEGPHPIPSRTRKLSPPGPMVLHGRLCGRVGRRQIFPFHVSGSPRLVDAGLLVIITLQAQFELR